MTHRPVVLPDSYSGEAEFSEWHDHFENVAAVNRWDDDAKLLWLKVRLTGRAQKAFKRLPQATQGNYQRTMEALKERFEPGSKRELHVVEFHARRKGRTESWADFAEDIKTLADKAYPDLEDAARERLSLNRYLEQLGDPQVAFGVKQSRPKSLDEAVTATLELESYKVSAPTATVSQVAPGHGDVEAISEPTASATVVGSIGGRENPTDRLLQTILRKVERLESRVSELEQTCRTTGRQYVGDGMEGATKGTRVEVRKGGAGVVTGDGAMQPVICRKCGKEGHYARGCAMRRRTNQGNF